MEKENCRIEAVESTFDFPFRLATREGREIVEFWGEAEGVSSSSSSSDDEVSLGEVR
jgi:hypothetical protein